jgi:N-methylhydantoinase B
VSIDAVTLEVLRHALEGVADEMGAVLRRTAYSPNIKERADCSAAVFGPDAELVAQAEHIPVHLGSMPASVAAALDAFPDLGPGDQVLLNDPYAGGTHLNDLTLVGGVFDGSELLGYVANRAHHTDVGGEAPGSIPAGATHIDQEGVRISPTLLYRSGAIEEATLERVVSSSRSPTERKRCSKVKTHWPNTRRLGFMPRCRTSRGELGRSPTTWTTTAPERCRSRSIAL